MESGEGFNIGNAFMGSGKLRCQWIVRHPRDQQHWEGTDSKVEEAGSQGHMEGERPQHGLPGRSCAREEGGLSGATEGTQLLLERPPKAKKEDKYFPSVLQSSSSSPLAELRWKQLIEEPKKGKAQGLLSCGSEQIKKGQQMDLETNRQITDTMAN